jgi:hypothetical protein
VPFKLNQDRRHHIAKQKHTRLQQSCKSPL